MDKPKEANLQCTLFDTSTCEVSLESKRPWLLQRSVKEFNHADLAENGIDLFIEKPLSHSIKDIKKLEKIATDKKIIVVGGGNEAEKRIKSLLNEKCEIIVISDSINTQIQHLILKMDHNIN